MHTGLSIEASSSEGAILVLPKGASRTDVNFPGRFESYATKHAENWYQFANSVLQANVPNGALYIITGSDTTSHWGTSAWHGRRDDVSVALKFSACAAQAAAGIVYRWEDQNSASVFSHPDAEEASEPCHWNQSVFVRGIRVAVADTLFQKLFRVKVRTTDMGHGRSLSRKNIPFASRPSGSADYQLASQNHDGHNVIQGPGNSLHPAVVSMPELTPVCLYSSHSCALPNFDPYSLTTHPTQSSNIS